jgi:hypothetical protein
MTWFVVTLPDSSTQEFELPDKSKGQDLLDAVSIKSFSIHLFPTSIYPKFNSLCIYHTFRFARNSKLSRRTFSACNTQVRKEKDFGWTDETKLADSCLVLNRTDCVFAWNSLLNRICWSKTTQSKWMNTLFRVCKLFFLYKPWKCFGYKRLFSWSRIFSRAILESKHYLM